MTKPTSNKAAEKQTEELKPQNAVATTAQGGAVAAYDYGDAEGQGFENVSKDDLTIPFLKLLQKISPEVDKETPQYIQGAEAGQFINSVSQETYDGKEGMVFVPAITQHNFVEWKPREQGGGFVAIHAADSQVVAKAKEASTKFGSYKTPEGNDLIETFNIFGVTVDKDGDPSGMAVMAFTSTKIKPYRNFMAKLNMFQIKTPSGAKKTPPLFAHRVKISAVKTKNAKGDFYNVVFAPAIGTSLADSLLPPGHKLLEAGKECYDLVKGGKAQADFSKETAATASAGGSDEEIPF